MTIRLDEKIFTVEGKEIPDTMTEAKAPLTVRAAVCHALFAQFPDDDKIGGEEKFKRAALAMKIYDTPEVKLTVEQIALAKRMVARLYSPLIVYRVWSVLDEAELVEQKDAVDTKGRNKSH